MKLLMTNPDEATLIENIVIHGHLIGAGFKFDGASIPRAFWGLIGSPFTGKYRNAALLHDALYASELYDRDMCDELFLNAMEQDGVNWLRRYTMWSAVRAGGWVVWMQHTEESINKAKEYIRRV